jgi:hypothetical protein
MTPEIRFLPDRHRRTIAHVVHLGPFAIVAAVLVAGTWIAATGMPEAQPRR